MQNFFRVTGDVCHLLSFVVMFWKLHSSESVAGVSLKTQELYAIVFIARYPDLFWNFLSIYNWVRAAPAFRSPPPPLAVPCRDSSSSLRRAPFFPRR